MKSKNIWFTCCTHYNHENILKFNNWAGELERPEFSNVNEMNECLMDSWNEVVKPDDTVYHLGDVFFGDHAKFEKDFRKFNGNKRLVLGNHDNIKYLASTNFFSRIYTDITLSDYGIFVSHRPSHESQMYDYRNQKNLVNVHGHIHRNPSPSERHYNVCVEQSNYYPVNLDTIVEYVNNYNDSIAESV